MNELAFLLKVFFGAVLRAFFPAAFDAARERARDTAEDTRPQPDLRNRLSQRIRAKWGRQALAGGTMALALVCVAGCGTRTILVPDGEPVRLREPIRNAKVWVMGDDGKPVASKVKLPAGWYCLPDPGDKPEPAAEPAKPADPPAQAMTPDIPIVYATPAPAPVARPLIP